MQPTIISKCQKTQVLKQKNLALLKQDSKLLYSTLHEPLAIFGCHKIWTPPFRTPYFLKLKLFIAWKEVIQDLKYK